MAVRLFLRLSTNGAPLYTSLSVWQRFFSLTSNLRGVSAIKLTMPALTPTMEVGKIVKWHKNEGDAFSAGDVLCDIETDKATLSMDALDDGVMAKILVSEGTENIKTSRVIALTVDVEDDYTQVEIPSDLETTEQEEVAAIEKTSGDSTTRDKQSVAAMPAASTTFKPTLLPLSPAVKRLVDEHQLDVNNIAPSGFNGRLLKGDVLEFLAGKQAQERVGASTMETTVQLFSPPPSIPDTLPVASAPTGTNQFDDIPNSNIRRTIAKRLGESKSTIPHVYASVDCLMDNMLALRRKLKADHRLVVSINDLVLKAAAVALRLVPEMNCNWTSSGLQRCDDIDVAVAVAIDGGLITPIVRGADKLSIADISSTARDLSARARAGKLQPHEYQGGSFSVSNLGMFGITNFTAVINPPQVFILAIGSLQSTPNPEQTVSQISTISISHDARAVDEHTASNYLLTLKRCIENPTASGLL
ncbi:uncharacterized protein LOC134188727 [Corticium candelabrum]|uniref:uncharacterized protein LOC134188727 n=1 Tax=Corticium candelabrum TaxID=121492 RepID=UPI002E270786|nr:uncharacterized protein LOC134188727 [Corticium candelabrum]